MPTLVIKRKVRAGFLRSYLLFSVYELYFLQSFLSQILSWSTLYPRFLSYLWNKQRKIWKAHFLSWKTRKKSAKNWGVAIATVDGIGKDNGEIRNSRLRRLRSIWLYRHLSFLNLISFDLKLLVKHIFRTLSTVSVFTWCIDDAVIHVLVKLAIWYIHTG